VNAGPAGPSLGEQGETPEGLPVRALIGAVRNAPGGPPIGVSIC